MLHSQTINQPSKLKATSGGAETLFTLLPCAWFAQGNTARYLFFTCTVHHEQCTLLRIWGTCYDGNLEREEQDWNPHRPISAAQSSEHSATTMAFLQKLKHGKACLKAGSTGELRNVAFGKLDNLFQQRPASSWLVFHPRRRQVPKKSGSDPKKTFSTKFFTGGKNFDFCFFHRKEFLTPFLKNWVNDGEEMKKISSKESFDQGF